MSDQAYPLSWPNLWPRTDPYRRMTTHKFGSRGYELMFDRARRQLTEELKRLGAMNIIMSTNVPLRLDGLPYASAATKRMDDPGVAVYFKLKGRDFVMAQDRYTDIAANIRSLTLAIEGMRQLERHGGGVMMEKAFTGFAALPNPGGADWRSILGFDFGQRVTRDEIGRRYRHKAAELHPDRGGSEAAMSQLNVARDQALSEVTQ